ncbi:hypothetical protein [Nannocystis punicea]|uniref:Uncharacterized protein n=1 Tax=Nannocystis punicea TaxID=2995304 RepID=A0ABY7GVL3_9BACT|nr:hypothetical protein [Nannocystis poenicansa]WAS90996.1 hypothetical protein O0S08_32810 [Nannocystis poenicansa]
MVDGEAEIGLKRERQQALAGLIGGRAHAGHLAHGTCRGAHQVIGRESILGIDILGRRRAHHRRIQHECVGTGDQHALGAAATLSLFADAALMLFEMVMDVQRPSFRFEERGVVDEDATDAPVGVAPQQFVVRTRLRKNCQARLRSGA